MEISVVHNKILTCHDENLNLSSWTFRPFIMKYLNPINISRTIDFREAWVREK